MTTPLQPPTRSLLGACLRSVAAASLLALLAAGASAQDNDDDGVLPFSGGSTDDGSGGGSSSGSGNGESESVTIQPDVLVAGELQDELDPSRATLELAALEGTAQLVTEVPAEDATFVANPAGVAAGEIAHGQALQGSGLLNLNEGLQARFVPAQLATKSVALLVIAADGPTLEAEVSGATQPELIVPLGGATPIDLARFAAVTERFGEVLPGYHATIVFVSVQAGELHTAAVRAHTEGGPVEVLVR